MVTLQAWVFMRVGIVRHIYGEVRFRKSTDVPLTDPSFEPGWVRMPGLDQTIDVPDFSQYDGQVFPVDGA